MKKQNYHRPTISLKPDLKHDNMEYSAASDGDDRLDQDKETLFDTEAGDITAEELSMLGEEDIDTQAAALITAETDSKADADNFLEISDKEELLEEMEDETDDDI